MTRESVEAKRVLPLIVFAQFATTSLWFAGNAVLPELQKSFNLSPSSLGDLTSSVQIGFILGTLVFAILSISDRFSPSRVFFICAIAGSLVNLLCTIVLSSASLFIMRGVVGFFLAGIYPVGMKISADYHEKGLGKALGYLVGALVIGTASPHLIRMLNPVFSWRIVFYATSALALTGGILIYYFVPDGPFRKTGNKFDLKLCLTVFQNKKFRSAAFGYFGHMWELYTVWAFIPFLILKYNVLHATQINTSMWSFLIIASGGLACMATGHWAVKVGSGKAAAMALFISGLCCLMSGFSFNFSYGFFLFFLIVWGASVVADSPQFSALIAKHAPVHGKGSALTIVNSIGFAITIPSIQLMTWLIEHSDSDLMFTSLAIGPLLGLAAIRGRLIG